jgi:shikimate dehydrogenase
MSLAYGMVKGAGAFLTQKGSYPEMAASIQERSVEAIRKTVQELKGQFSLFDVSLRSFGLKADPEGRARLGIAMNQLSATMKNRMIIGCGPEVEMSLDPGPVVRNEITRLGIERGFAWVEYDIGLDAGTVKKLRGDTLRTGSRLLLSVDPSIHSHREISESLWGCDGIKLSMDIGSRTEFDLILSARDQIGDISPATPIFIRPKGRYGHLLQSLSSLLGHVTMCLDPSMSPLKEPSEVPLKTLEYSHKLVSLHLGLKEDLRKTSFSMSSMPMGPSVGMAFLLGHPVQHSLESILHNRAFKSEGSSSIMVPIGCGIDSLDAGIDLLRDMRPIGATVTLPIRSLIGRKLDTLDPQAKRLGAVNTIKVESGKLHGYNTEYSAACDVLGKYIEREDSVVLILGTGGAARSIAAASSDMGFRTILCGSNVDRTLQVARSIGGNTGATTLQAISKMKGKVTVLVNATPEGMNMVRANEGAKLGISDIARNIEASFGIDLIYSPPWTAFLSSIESRGGVPVSGIEMLVAEAVRSHYLWTGVSPRAEELKLCAMEAHPILIAG